MKRFRSSLRIKDDFNIAIDPLIEFLKRIGRLRERQAMRNDLTRPGTTGDNHIAQLGVVALIRIAAHANGDSFTEERLPRNCEITAFFDLPDRLRDGTLREPPPRLRDIEPDGEGRPWPNEPWAEGPLGPLYKAIL